MGCTACTCSRAAARRSRKSSQLSGVLDVVVEVECDAHRTGALTGGLVGVLFGTAAEQPVGIGGEHGVRRPQRVETEAPAGRQRLLNIIEEEGFRGVYFEPGDPISLADALARVLDDPELRTGLGRQNYAAASGIPMSEVVHWHLIHIRRVLGRTSDRITARR